MARWASSVTMGKAKTTKHTHNQNNGDKRRNYCALKKSAQPQCNKGGDYLSPFCSAMTTSSMVVLTGRTEDASPKRATARDPRAAAVTPAARQGGGGDAGRLTAEGYGKDHPIADDSIEKKAAPRTGGSTTGSPPSKTICLKREAVSPYTRNNRDPFGCLLSS